MYNVGPFYVMLPLEFFLACQLYDRINNLNISWLV